MKPLALLMLCALFVATTAEIPTGQAVHGIGCESMEGNVLHIHQHLAILDHGKPVGVPADVGRPMFASCLYWLHTHTPDGIIHVESPTFRTYTLGDFFDIWGEPLEPKNVAGAKLRAGEKIVVWVNGARYSGNPRTIPLTQHLDIMVDVGAPQLRPAAFTAWNGN